MLLRPSQRGTNRVWLSRSGGLGIGSLKISEIRLLALGLWLLAKLQTAPQIARYPPPIEAKRLKYTPIWDALGCPL